MAYADLNRRSSHLPSIAGVAAVHALIGYALISGLATDFIKQVTPVFTVKSIEADPTPPPVEPAQPPEQNPASERATTVPPRPADMPALPRDPVIVALPATGFESTLDPVIVPLPPMPPQPQPQVSRSASAQVQGNRAGWITTEDYPSAALRAEEEGTVGISVRVGADGRVAGCTVTVSSGHPALDAATCRIYQRRARFSPARNDAGSAIETGYTDRVRWQLPRQ